MARLVFAGVVLYDQKQGRSQFAIVKSPVPTLHPTLLGTDLRLEMQFCLGKKLAAFYTFSQPCSPSCEIIVKIWSDRILCQFLWFWQSSLLLAFTYAVVWRLLQVGSPGVSFLTFSNYTAAVNELMPVGERGRVCAPGAAPSLCGVKAL